jgi:GTP-binding protein
MYSDYIRNVAIIAHVDHGKMTLVDHLLYQSDMFRAGELDKLAVVQHNLIMDLNPLEKEKSLIVQGNSLRLLTSYGVHIFKAIKIENAS